MFGQALTIYHPFVNKDSIGDFGICTSCGYAFNTAETEMQIKVVTPVSAFDLWRAKHQY